MSNTFLIGNTHETRHSIRCALFSPEIVSEDVCISISMLDMSTQNLETS